MKKVFENIIDTSLIGARSLKFWGATAAANASVHDHMFKRHRCWRSDKAKDGYISDSLEERLKVSKSLGI